MVQDRFPVFSRIQFVEKKVFLKFQILTSKPMEQPMMD